MKKITFLVSILVFLTAFTCENEPLEGDFTTEDVLSCEIAAQNTQDAAIAFLDVTDENYIQLCIAYRNALEVQIEFCDDPEGILQTQINSLGDCGSTNPDPCETVTIAAAEAETAYNEDLSNSTLCNAYLTALQIQLTVCGDANGNIQATINGLDCGITNPDSCEIATIAADEAETAYNSDTTNFNLCNAYKIALQNKITACGDTNGNIQTVIDDLGDCGNDNTPNYEIGDIGPGGGYVFYLDNTGGGMEIAPVETEFLTQWGCYSTSISGTVVDFGSGLNNTNIILDYHNSINFYNDPEQCQEFVNPVGIIQSTGDVAAKICSDLNLNGFDDWYLPSIGELELVYTNLFSQGFGDFSGSTASNLASSSDDYSNDYRLFTIDLTSGSVVNDYKYNLVYYRAVRSF